MIIKLTLRTPVKDSWAAGGGNGLGTLLGKMATDFDFWITVIKSTVIHLHP